MGLGKAQVGKGQVRKGTLVGQRVAVLGGGVAGLAFASLTAERGAAVTVYERAEWGGKLGGLEVGGLRFSTGPSLLTFPGVWAAFLGASGEEVPSRAEGGSAAELPPDWQPLPGGLGLHYTPHGTVPLPVPPDHPLFPDWARYTRAAAPLAPHLVTLLTTPPSLRSGAFLRASRALFGVTGRHPTAAGWLGALELPPALGHALATHALNAGLPPERAPALYALIPALTGSVVGRPVGGFGRLRARLLDLARARGAELRLAEVTGVTPGGEVRLGGGEVARFDRVVSALDPWRLAALLGRARRPSPLARRTVSGVALYAALDSPLALPATSVLTPDTFAGLGAALRAGALPASTLGLLHAGGEEGGVPGSGRGLALLLTVPATGEALTPGHPWVLAQARAALRRVGGEEAWEAYAQALAAGRVAALDPAHYAAGGHPGGAIYGAAHPLWRAGPLHPHPHRLSARVWQVGGGVHPGGGLPAVLGGALQVAAELSGER